MAEVRPVSPGGLKRRVETRGRNGERVKLNEANLDDLHKAAIFNSYLAKRLNNGFNFLGLLYIFSRENKPFNKLLFQGILTAK